MAGQDLAQGRERAQPYDWNGSLWALGTGLQARRRRRSFHVVAYDYGVKHNILRNLAERGCKVTVLPAQPPRRRRRSRSSPTASSSPTAPAIPEPCDYAIEAIREIVATGTPVFGICLGPPAARARRGREDRQDEVRPPRRQPPGAGPRHRRASSSPARTTASRWTRRRCPPTCAPRTARSSTARCRASSSPTGPPTASRATPRRSPGPARDGVPVRQVRGDDAGAQGLMPKRTDIKTHPDHRRRPDRDRPGLRVRLFGRAGVQGAARRGLPRDPGELQPGHDHDRPGDGRRHLHRADHLADGGARSSRRSAPTRCCRPWAGRRRSTARSTSRARACSRSSRSR